MHQYGFRSHCPTIVVDTIVENILEGFENKIVVGACLVCKDFDCISHKIILKKTSILRY